MPPGYFSFFSGALGLDLGLEQAGLTPYSYNEIDRSACETIRLNRPGVRLYSGDIRGLDPSCLLAEAGLMPGEAFLVCGGPPCQAFSTAGHRQGLNDERGNVFLTLLDMIGAIKPKYFLIENVRGLLSAPMVHRPHKYRSSTFPPLAVDELRGGALSFILALAESYGYGVSFQLYNTARFGIPQSRERLVMIGARDGSRVPYLSPGGAVRTFRDVCAGLGGHEHGQFRASRLPYFKMLGPGQNWRNLPPEMQEKALGKAYFATGGRVGFYRRLDWDKPAPTLVTCPTMPATDLAHPQEDRPLSVQEYMRLQTFPDDWQLSGSLAARYRQLGNAVPVDFGRQIGEHLLAFDRGERLVSCAPTSRYRDTDDLSWRNQTGVRS